MSSAELIVAMIAVGCLLATALLYVIFGQLTVKKLRKNPETRDKLGIEFVSGWNIVNVAEALALPRRWSRTLENGPFGALYARSQIIRTHTTKVDRFLAVTFFWMLMTTGGIWMALTILSTLGYFAPS